MRSRIAIVSFILAAVALAASAWATIGPLIVRQDAAAVQSQAKSLADQVAEACAKGGSTAAALGSACAKAAEVRDQPNVAQAAPQPDPEAIRQAARTAVAEYCAAPSHPCRGSDGATPNFDLIVDAVVGRIPAPKNGADGQNTTAAQVADTVAAYCGQPSEPCRGAAGTPGTDGKDGKDGRDGVDGQPGPSCPEGYELRDALITARDGTTYSGKACVDPASSAPPPSTTPPPLGGS